MTTSEWPDEDIEELGHCPVCGTAQRELAYAGVRDQIFGAPGSWSLQRCSCGILYLDPRPSEASIGRAYVTYHTHQSAGPELLWRIGGAGGAARRGYLNARYGYRLPAASRLLAEIWRRRRRFAAKHLDFTIRHLGAPKMLGAKILDVGCGNGDFLKVAEDLGHAAVGIDPDPRAVELARGRGLDVRRGSLPRSGLEPGSFDHIFLAHVLEHLHRPVAALEEALALLAPGGRLWISQPNAEAPGLERFGRHWRGLEPPRHLSLTAPVRLMRLLAELGYSGIALLPAEEAAAFYYRQSQALKHGMDPYGAADPPEWDERILPAAVAADALARSRPGRGESLTITAWKRL